MRGSKDEEARRLALAHADASTVLPMTSYRVGEAGHADKCTPPSETPALRRRSQRCNISSMGDAAGLGEFLLLNGAARHHQMQAAHE